MRRLRLFNGNGALVLLAIVQQTTVSLLAVSEQFNDNNNRLVFDCTGVINEFLKNGKVDSMDKSLLEQTLNHSPTIYYQMSEYILHFFPERFIKMTSFLEQYGWTLGGTTGNTLLLSMGIFQNYNFTQTRLSEDWKKYQVNISSSSTTPSRRLPIQIILSWRDDDHPQPPSNGSSSTPLDFFYYNLNLKDLFNLSQSPAPSFEIGESQLGPSLPIDFNEPTFELILLTVELVAGLRLPESYWIFREHMNSVVAKNAKYFLPHQVVQFAVRLLLHPCSFQKKEGSITEGYTLLLARFANKWAAEEARAHHSVIIEMSPVSASNYKGLVADIVPSMRGSVTPILNAFSICRDCLLNLQNTAPLVASKFSAVSVDEYDLFCECSTTATTTTSNKLSRSRLSSTTAVQKYKQTIFTSDSSINLLLFQSASFESLDDLQKTILFQNPLFRDHVQVLVVDKYESQFLHLDTQSNISIQFSCDVPIGPLSQFPEDSTGFLLNHVVKLCKLGEDEPPIVAVVQLHIDHVLGKSDILPDGVLFNGHSYMELVQPKLESIYRFELELRQRFPGSRVLLYFKSTLASNIKTRLSVTVSAYCSPKLFKLNQLAEALIAWSYLHNVTIVFKNVLSKRGSYYSYDGWWEPIEVPGGGGVGMNNKTVYSPIYLMRNYPDTMGYLKVDPCLASYKALPQVPIPIVRTATAGRRMMMGLSMNLTMKMGGGSSGVEVVDQGGLHTQLQYALHKFSHVQIACGGQLETGEVKGLMSTLENVLPSTSKVGAQNKIIIDFSLKKTTSGRRDTSYLATDEVLKMLSQVAEEISSRKLTKFVSIQISDWEESYQELPTEFYNLFQGIIENSCRKLKVEVGLVVHRCSRVLANETELFFGSTKLFSLAFSHFLCVEPWNISYVLVDDQVNNYWQTSSKILDATYASKVVLGRLLPGIRTFYFRFDIGTSSTEEFLRSVRDVNEHARLFNMSYFAVRGFGGGMGVVGTKEVVIGWWRVVTTNNSELFNVSSYIETESEYLGIDMWRPPQYIPNHGDDDDGGGRKTNWRMITISVVLLVGAVFPVQFLLWRKFISNRFLTRSEEREFLEGVSGADNDDGDGTMENDYLRMRFNPDLQIPKVIFNSDSNRILGMGNFGMVFKAVVAGSWVAVKVPKDGRSKEGFKATLQEIKILCHVGAHPHVLRFVGAYIKEIGKGVVQIATELCENGTLLSHLRAYGRILGGVGGDAAGSHHHSAMNSLDLERFCLEIASGMEYLASKQIIHGDLAARNVLLDEHLTCKISDFGLSRKLYEYEKYVKTSQDPLPWRWMAPESLKKMEFSSKSDVWSFGVTLWEIYSLGDVPYPCTCWSSAFTSELVDDGLRLPKPQYSTNELYTRLLECWNIEPGRRPSFPELREFFQTLRDAQYILLEEEDENMPATLLF